MHCIPSSTPSPAPSTEGALPVDLSSGTTAPSSSAEQAAEPVTPISKKKKKKKGKKASVKPAVASDGPAPAGDAYSTAPCLLSRNKHMRYISSYQGSWLQLPIELLDSLLTLNLEPLPLHSPEQHMSSSSRKTFISGLNGKQRVFERTATSSSDHTPPDSPPLFSVTPLLDALSEDLPPPIDPGVFRSVISIRRLVEEATSLTLRANSGLSAAALGSMQITPNASPWALAQSLGINPLGDSNVGNGRKTAMSATRIHRLRVLAVQKLAAAYRHDEIAASVMTMQSGSVFDDLADRVLKADPHHSDAVYVNHFHEKIPSRQVGEYTTTDALDGLIAAHPHCSEYYRSRGIIYTFREEYTSATRDFTHVLNQARSARKARTAHVSGPPTGKGSKKKKASSNGSQREIDISSPRSTTGEDAPEPIELQALFLRASTYIQHAASIIESKALSLEGVPKPFLPNGQELRLAEPLPGARYGGVETGHPDGPLGARDGVKASAYRETFAGPQLRQQVSTLARKSIRDAERFLTHFGALDPPGPGSGVPPIEEVPGRIAYSYALAAALRPGVRANLPTPPADLPRPAIPPPYHPLLVEAHFIIILGHLLLGDFTAVLHGLIRAARVVEVLEGGPVFLPPRSLAQAEVIEILERLAGCWENGTKPSSQALSGNGKGAASAMPALAYTSNGQGSSSHAPSSAASGSASSSTIPATTSHPDISSSDALTTVAGLYGSCEERTAQIDAARLLLAAVVVRQNAQSPTSSPQLSIPLYGPRVEIALAWLGAVWIPALE